MCAKWKFLSLTPILWVCLWVHAPVQAETASTEDNGVFAALAPMDQTDLSQSQGGLMIDGVPLSLGVVVSTVVTNAKGQTSELQTTYQLTPQNTMQDVGEMARGRVHVIQSANGNDLTANFGRGTNLTQIISSTGVQTLISNSVNGITLNHDMTLTIGLKGLAAGGNIISQEVIASQLGINAHIMALHY